MLPRNHPVSLPDHVMQSRKRRQISEKALRAVGLEKHQQIMPGQLTPEQRLSVVIARELVHDPDVMFADDAPFTIDLDSTICERYGLAKEGARHHGYTGKRGCCSKN